MKRTAKHPKIIVCTTFRDFKGTENDDIQRLFLRSLESQTYKNFELVVTLFGEKNVCNELCKYNFQTTFYEGDSKGFRYSLSQVILNAIDYIKAEVKSDLIILWTTADVIYDKHFFETVVKRVSSNIIGTSHPHKSFSSIEDYRKESLSGRKELFSGFDLVFFGSSFISKESVINSLENYTYNDWGIFENFLISLNKLIKSVDMINLYEEAQIYKIENNREITKEPSNFLVHSHKRNRKTFNRFLKENNITNAYFDLAYCHLRFKLTNKKFKHYWSFRIDYLKVFLRSLKRFLKRILPDRIKNFLRKKFLS